ncbi:MAG: M28 family peptidase [Candidatus Zixiibacteriota bacterium]|jgi:photosystem II stability/assembly factor-like uncharacterized protein
MLNLSVKAAVGAAIIFCISLPAYGDEPPPEGRDGAISSALDGITNNGIRAYVEDLQGFKTRYSYMPGCDEARDYIEQRLESWGYRTRVQQFPGGRLAGSRWGDGGNSAWVMTEGCTLFHTDDGGVDWVRQVPAAPGYLYDVHFVDESVGYAACGGGVVAATTDGGMTWENLTVEAGSEDAFRAVYFREADVGWAACFHGAEARIYRTADGGLEWTAQSLPQYGCPHIISFGDLECGWAVPGSYEDAVVYRTVNGGANWELQDFPVPPASVKSFVALDGAVAWAAYGGSSLLYTRDGGETWLRTPEFSSHVLTAVAFAGPKVGYAAGNEVIYKTDDGGLSWYALEGAPLEFWGDVAFGDEDHGLLIDLYGRELYLTSDGGASFERINSRVDLSWENIIAERRGTVAPDEIVLMGAHYDSTSDRPAVSAPGADAAGAGVAAALAAAEVFRDLPVDRTLRFVFFGGAEQGYLGSRAYAEEASAKDEDIIAAVLMDMIGYDEDAGGRDDAIIRISGSSIWLADHVGAVGGIYNTKMLFDYQLNGGAGDHVPFWDARYDSIGFFEGGPESESESTYPYYHTAEDTLDKLTVPLVTRTARTAAAVVGHLARSDYIGVEDPPTTADTAPRVARPFAVYPNPFRYAAAAGLTFTGVSSPATVAVYDVAGRRIASCEVPAGAEDFRWRPARPGGEPLGPGVYIYRVSGRDQLEVGKVVVDR